ncbi:MAG: hypothetical protein U1F77_06700 [Kiritimatiellia bacterium]
MHSECAGGCFAEIRAFSGTVPAGEMERLFEGLNVERLILRAQNRRDPTTAWMPSTAGCPWWPRPRARPVLAGTPARLAGLRQQLPRKTRRTLLLRVFNRLCEEHQVYSFARHAVRTHASLHGGTERDALLLLAKAAGEGRVLLEPNGHPLDQAEGVALFLASVQRKSCRSDSDLRHRPGFRAALRRARGGRARGRPA